MGNPEKGGIVRVFKHKSFGKSEKIYQRCKNSARKKIKATLKEKEEKSSNMGLDDVRDSTL